MAPGVSRPSSGKVDAARLPRSLFPRKAGCVAARHPLNDPLNGGEHRDPLPRRGALVVKNGSNTCWRAFVKPVHRVWLTALKAHVTAGLRCCCVLFSSR